MYTIIIFSNVGKSLRRACSSALLCSLVPLAETVGAEQFDSSFLRRLGTDDPSLEVDLDTLKSPGSLAPGIYPLSIRLNGRLLGRRSVQWVSQDNGAPPAPCLSADLLESLEVNLDPALQPTCIDLPNLIEGASQTLDVSTLTLDIGIPQAALRRQPSGFVDEKEWDSGINAAMLNYQLSAAQAQRQAEGSTYQSNLYLQAGINVGPWRLRSNSAFSQGRDSPARWQRSNTYAQRDLTRNWGTLTLGEHFTPGDIFDSLPYRGVQLSSDIGMLPDSMQGYAPVIRGIAETQARVEIRQNNYSLYTTFVPPGPFVIDDLSAAGGSGELEVIITEADGRERRFVQPYATLSNMLRQGVWRHSLTLGQYNSGDGQSAPEFAQATLAYGLPLDLTLYGGLQTSSFYQALQTGLGKNLGMIGAVSLDITQARTEAAEGGQDSGQSYGWRYGKSFDSGTSIRFAGYRYSTQGYRDFGEAVWQQDARELRQGSKRNRLEASLAQSTPYGSLFLSLNQQTYWQNRAREQQLQLGLNTYYRGVSYGLYASRTLSGDYRANDQVTLTVSLPLGRRSTASYTAAGSNQGAVSHRANLAGQLGDHQDWRYGLNAGRSESGQQTATASLNYRAPFMQLGSSVSGGAGYRQATLSASGSLLAHADGIELGHSLGETVALIDTHGVADIGVQNAPGTRTNGRGYSLVPYLTPYRHNRIALDTDHLGMDIDVDNGISHTTPRRGAVIKARFNVSRSRKIIADLRMPDGTSPPFGSQVLDGQGHVVGVVGPGGQVLLAVGEADRHLVAKWNEHSQGHCAFDLQPHLESERLQYSTQTLVCNRSAEVATAANLPSNEANL